MTPKGCFFIACLFLQLQGISGQVPGYLGKKLFIKADASATVALRQPTAANRGYGDLYGDATSSFGLNTRFGGQIGYTVSRTGVVTIAGDYLKTGMIADRLVTPTLNPSASPLNYDYHSLFYNLTGLTADIGYQIYNPKRGAIAPMGNYISYHLSASFLTGEILDRKTAYYDGSQKKIAQLGINPHYTNYYVGVEWGKNMVFADRFMLCSAVRLNVPLNIIHFVSYNTDKNVSDYEGRYTEYNQAFFNDKVAQRMFSHSFLTVRVGVGILP